MDTMAIGRENIDSKLEKESHNLSMLKEAMNKSAVNTQNMLGILNSFESRLKRLEGTIVPVYNETENLRRRQENVEKTLVSLDSVLSYFHVAKDVEQNIKEGPSSIGLENYLAEMDKILMALKYFNKHDPNSLELSEVSRVYDDGKESLQNEFRACLHRHGKRVQPIVILDLLGMDDELQEGENETVLEHFPEKIVSDLSAITKWLSTNDNSSDYVTVYTSARSGVLVKSLQGLKEHLKSASGSTSGSYFSHVGQSSPSLTNKFRVTKDTSARKSMKKIAYFTKKASSALIKSPFEQGHRRQASSTEVFRDDTPDIEFDSYITELSALLKLMQSELHVINQIIPEKHQRVTFDTIIQQGLEMVVAQGELLANNAKKNIGKHEFQSVLSIFPVVRHLRSIKPEFDFVLEGCQSPTRAKIAALLSTLDSTGAKALEEFISSIKNDPDKLSSMPKDGTVHELTSHVIIFLEHLREYPDTAGAMLLKHGEQATPSASLEPEKCKLKVADFITKVLSALGLNLSNKAETYSDPTLRPIFMLNNLNYILKSLKRSRLLELIHSWNKDVESYYQEQITEQKKLYSQSWSKVLHYLLEVHKPISQQRTQVNEMAKLKDKDRQNIKDKFSGFNKEFEEVYRIQKTYAVPDPELRETLKKDNKDFIIPPYQMFRDKYKNVNFTKNPDKYIKYSIESVSDMLYKFFDAAA